AAGVMYQAANASEAPGLVDAQVGDDVRNPETEAATGTRVIRKSVVVDDCTVLAEEGNGGVNGGFAATYRVFQRQRAGEAVAELNGIGPQVLASRTGVTRHPHVMVAVSAAVGEEVEERLRPAHREARKLHERAIPERPTGSSRRQCHREFRSTRRSGCKCAACRIQSAGARPTRSPRGRGS